MNSITHPDLEFVDTDRSESPDTVQSPFSTIHQILPGSPDWLRLATMQGPSHLVFHQFTEPVSPISQHLSFSDTDSVSTDDSEPSSRRFSNSDDGGTFYPLNSASSDPGHSITDNIHVGTHDDTSGGTHVNMDDDTHAKEIHAKDIDVNIHAKDINADIHASIDADIHANTDDTHHPKQSVPFMVIGVAGCAGSGKDTLSDLLLDHFQGTKSAFAGPLKKAAGLLFNLSDEQLHDRVLKEQVDQRWGLSPRVILQRLGSEGLRDLFDKDIFTKSMGHRMDAARERGEGLFIVTDVRFPNEAQMIRNNGTLIHLYRTDAKAVAEHVSEQILPIEEGDLVIENNGSIQELFDTAKHVLGI